MSARQRARRHCALLAASLVLTLGATLHARDLPRIVFGKAVELEPYDQDRYHRLVARIWLGDVDVNAAMIKDGYAWAYRRYLDDARYCIYEFDARRARRGLWQAPADQRVAPWEWRRRKALAGRFTDYSAQTVAECIAEANP